LFKLYAHLPVVESICVMWRKFIHSFIVQRINQWRPRNAFSVRKVYLANGTFSAIALGSLSRSNYSCEWLIVFRITRATPVRAFLFVYRMCFEYCCKWCCEISWHLWPEIFRDMFRKGGIELKCLKNWRHF